MEEMRQKPRWMPVRDDAALVAAVLAGEQQAYGELVARHEDQLYRHALRMTGDADAAADLVQAAFVRGYTQLGSCRDPARFGAWVFRIAANQSKDWLKSRRRRDVPLDVTPEGALATEEAGPGDDLERGELRRILARALEELPATLREAFVLKHVEGLEYEEMSALMEVSVSALKMRVHRARQMLQAALQEVR